MPQVSFTVSHSLAELGKMVEWRGRLGKRRKHRPLQRTPLRQPAVAGHGTRMPSAIAGEL